MVEIDISAYHPTLASSLIHYNFIDDDIHRSFARLYNVDYKKAKELTFKQLYGGVFKQYQHLEFFQKIQAYVEEIWTQFQNKGFIWRSRWVLRAIRCAGKDNVFIGF